MRKFWLMFVLASLIVSILAQSVTEDSFTAFLSNFEQDKKIDFSKRRYGRNISSEGIVYGDKIDTEIAVRFLGLEYTEYAPIVYADAVLFQNDQYLVLSYIIICGAGGICEARYIATVDHNGDFIDKLKLSSTFGDIDGTIKTRNVFFSDSLLIRTQYDIKHVSSRPQLDVLMRAKQTVFSVSDDGRFCELSTISINPMRKYYWLSTSLIQDRTLDGRSPEELAIMRNEIYASHGYIFDSQVLNSYFSRKQWYKPVRMNVSDELTWIESRNLETIMNRERRYMEEGEDQ